MGRGVTGSVYIPKVKQFVFNNLPKQHPKKEINPIFWILGDPTGNVQRKHRFGMRVNSFLSLSHRTFDNPETTPIRDEWIRLEVDVEGG